MLLYSARPLLELANYKVLGRIFYYVPYFSPLPPDKVMTTFGGLMVMVETLNALGVSLSANPTAKNPELGIYLTIAAIGIQLVVILIFISLAAVFHHRCAKANLKNKAVITSLYILYVSMALIFIRCIYRFVEHLDHKKVDITNIEALRAITPLKRYEWVFYIFEASFMLVNSVIWNIWNPGRYLPKYNHIYLARDGITELEGESDRDDRPLLVKTGSVLTFGLLFRKKPRTQTQSVQELSQYSATHHQV
jgi:hypothetical protein